MKTRSLNEILPEILADLNLNRQRVYRISDIENLLRLRKEAGDLAKKTTTQEFIDALITGGLRAVELLFPHTRETRFIWKKASSFEVAMTLKPRSYLTHLTALHLHDLSMEGTLTSVFVNSEQRQKGREDRQISQEGIHTAFRNPQRVTKNVCIYEKRKIFVLNGMSTNELGVVTIDGPEGEILRVTDVERTLIDSVVRPFYANGVQNVLGAFKRAKQRNIVSINKLVTYLRGLNYIYPYHQAIGFYLEATGLFDNSLIKRLREFPIELDFYLCHQMKDLEYSTTWRIYYPKDMA